MKLNARELREVDQDDLSERVKKLKRNQIYFILENIYDTYNIGGLFRLADALLVEKIYLCGETEVPPNSKIKKASIGTYKVVPWEYKRSVQEALGDIQRALNIKHETLSLTNNKLSTTNYKLTTIAVEQSKESIPYTQAKYEKPLALIFGNETYGVLPETLKLADQIVEIPMWGINKSLNVIVSAAIVSYRAISR